MQFCKVKNYKLRVAKIVCNISFLSVEISLKYTFDCILSLKYQKLELT